MRLLKWLIVVVTISVMAVFGMLASQRAMAETEAEIAEIVAKLSAAAPAELVKAATIAVLDKDGKMRVVRKGTNNFTCMNIPGSAMCADKNAMAWLEAYLAKKKAPKAAGFIYMLSGDEGASNTDPYAEAKTADNHWVVTGPHVMIVGGDAATRKGYPKTADPDPTKPYVMWPGTAYEHLMLPTK